MSLGVADRIWACVSLQWEWLGGVRAIPDAEIVVSGSERHARAA
jgi:hypothetical protein